MTYPVVTEPVEKIELICRALAAHRTADFQQLVDMGRHSTKTYEELSHRARIEEVLGEDSNTISNWKWTPTRPATSNPNPGLMLGIASIGGFSPDGFGIEQLVETYQKTRDRKNPFPRFLYEVMTLWTDNSIERSLWIAFVGDHEQIESDPATKSYSGSHFHKALGLPAAAFGDLYNSSVRSLTLRLPVRAYWRKDIPPLQEHRAKRDFYLLTASTPADSYLPRSATPEVAHAIAAKRTELTASEISPPRGFEKALPHFEDAEIARSQKLALYGGGLRKRDLKFTPLQHVVAAHAFDRTIATQLTERIASDDQRFASITLRCRHGEGLSITLAQIVAGLYRRINVLPFWVIGDPSTTVEVLSALNVEAIKTFLSQMGSRQAQMRLVFIVDDVSAADGICVQNLLRFVRQCEDFSIQNDRFSFTFVFGVFGDYPSLGKDPPVELILSEADEASCFYKMTEGEPLILRDERSALSRILRASPASAYRTYGNDTQGFIDFLLECGRRTKLADDNWLARIDGLDKAQVWITSAIAASELLGLPVHENVILRLANERSGRHFDGLDDIAEFCPNTTITDSEWRGIGLTSPRRSRSILLRLNSSNASALPPLSNSLTTPLQTTLNDLFVAGLQCSRDGGTGGSTSADYSRHVIQRLGKPELFSIEDNNQIAQHIFARNAALILDTAKSSSLVDVGKWAGTLSGLLPYHSFSQPYSDPHTAALGSVASTTIELCNLALDRLNADAALHPEFALSMLRAARRLSTSNLLKARTAELCTRLSRRIWLGSILAIIECQLATIDTKLEYRVNQIILAAAQFKDVVSNPTSRKHKRQLFGWFLEFEKRLRQNGLGLDAGSWRQRARYTDARALQSLYLQNAAACAEFYRRQQGTWLSRIPRRSTLAKQTDAVHSGKRPRNPK